MFILLILILIFFYLNNITHINEHFIDLNQDDDIFDKEYIDIYDIAFNDYNDIKQDMILVNKSINIKQNDNILVIGCGVGKLCNFLKNKYNNITGLDKSTNMIKKSKKNFPNIKYINGNAINNTIFSHNLYNIIFIDERTLLYNTFDEQVNIIINCYDWLNDNGYLIMPIYNKDLLGVASRYYSSNYTDDLGIIHGFTHLNGFTHDCWYLDEIDKLEYYEKITLESGHKRVFKFDLYLMEENKLFDLILKTGFIVKDNFDTSKRIISGYQLVVFQKNKKKYDL